VAPFASSGHGSGVVAASPVGSAVFVFGAVVAVLAGLASISQSTLRGLYRAKVGVHAGFLVCAVASGHDGALVFAALTAALALSGFAFVVFAIERRCGAVSLVAGGGRAAAFKDLAAAFAVIGAAGVGLPGTIGFVADDLLLHAAWKQGPIEGVVLAGLLIVAAVFMAIGTLRGWQKVFLGPRVRAVAPDLGAGERIVVVVVIVVALVFGLAPTLILSLL
jgi:NADH-quinone oxidoreductase subunit M